MLAWGRFWYPGLRLKSQLVPDLDGKWPEKNDPTLFLSAFDYSGGGHCTHYTKIMQRLEQHSDVRD